MFYTANKYTIKKYVPQEKGVGTVQDNMLYSQCTIENYTSVQGIDKRVAVSS